MRQLRPEQSVASACVSWLEMQGYEVQRRNVGQVSRVYHGKTRCISFAQIGSCDYWLLIPECNGRLCEMETKRPGARPTVFQKAYMMKSNVLGGFTFWVDSLASLLVLWSGLLKGKHVVINCDGTMDFLGPDEWQQAREINYANMLTLFGDLSMTMALRRRLNQIYNPQLISSLKKAIMSKPIS